MRMSNQLEDTNAAGLPRPQRGRREQPAHRLRPVPVQRGHARSHVREAGCARRHRRRRAGRGVRRLGAERRRRQRHRRLQRLGPDRHAAARRAPRRASGKASSRASARARIYKYSIKPRFSAKRIDKADPFGFAAELRPSTASVVWDLESYQWHDQDWIAHRAERQAFTAPISIYEVHLGSWKRVPETKAF